MPYRIIDKDGRLTDTVYANHREAELHFEHSVDNPPAQFGLGVRDGEITVFDSNGDEIGSIRFQ